MRVTGLKRAAQALGRAWRWVPGCAMLAVSWTAGAAPPASSAQPPNPSPPAASLARDVALEELSGLYLAGTGLSPLDQYLILRPKDGKLEAMLLGCEDFGQEGTLFYRARAQATELGPEAGSFRFVLGDRKLEEKAFDPESLQRPESRYGVRVEDPLVFSGKLEGRRITLRCAADTGSCCLFSAVFRRIGPPPSLQASAP